MADQTKRAEIRPWQPVFVRRLERALAVRRMSGNQLAEKLEINRANISNWRALDTAPKADTLLSIANELGVSVDWLLGRGPEEFPGMSDYRPIERRLISAVIVGVMGAINAVGRQPQPEHFANAVLKSYDWAAEVENERRSQVTPEEVSTFVRHSIS